jgi:ribosomal protein L11 methyltransferase
MLVDLLQTVGAQVQDHDSGGASVEIEASFPGAEPPWLEDRLACWLFLLDSEAMPSLRSARGAEAWRPGWQALYEGADIGPFRVRPPWVTPPLEGLVLWVDPSAGFGGGRHPSTRLCLERLEALLREGPCRRVLDVGAGNGILSIAAARLGHAVTALEMDPRARQGCMEAARRNDVDVRVLDCPLEELHEDFDLVVANLTNRLVMALSSPLLQVTSAEGSLLLGGLHAQDLRAVEMAFGDRVESFASPCGEWWAAHARH